jgi:transcription elongation factor GreB
VPNYVTARGFALLCAELEALGASAGDAEHARRRAELEQRIASAELVAVPLESNGVVRFGASVLVRDSSGARRYRIVGVDEAEPAQGTIAFVSPLARALLGRRAGDTVVFRAPAGEQELEIAAVEYEPDPDA